MRPSTPPLLPTVVRINASNFGIGDCPLAFIDAVVGRLAITEQDEIDCDVKRTFVISELSLSEYDGKMGNFILDALAGTTKVIASALA
jgi:hypothetical protein